MELNKSVEVKELPQMTVAYVRKTGPWEGDKKQYLELREKLFGWASARGLMGSRNFQYLILYHDNPKAAVSANLSMSLCITIPPEIVVDGEIGRMEIEAAEYAIGRFEITVDDFRKAWEWMYMQWLPENGYRLDDKPYYETYPEEPKQGKFLVDLCIPIKQL